MISISQGVIVWSAIEGTDRIYHVYAIKADGVGRQTLAANARGPQISWPWVMYDVQPTTPGIADQLELRNLESGEIRTVSGPISVNYFAYDGSSVAWITQDGNSLYLMALNGGVPVLILSSSHLQFVQLNRRLIGWGQFEGAFVYDRKLRIIVRLADTYLFNPQLSDQAVDWMVRLSPITASMSDNSVLKMVNISDLP
jgi:hypothetical protein